jgi:hypothetical protein
LGADPDQQFKINPKKNKNLRIIFRIICILDDFVYKYKVYIHILRLAHCNGQLFVKDSKVVTS